MKKTIADLKIMDKVYLITNIVVELPVTEINRYELVINDEFKASIKKPDYSRWIFIGHYYNSPSTFYLNKIDALHEFRKKLKSKMSCLHLEFQEKIDIYKRKVDRNRVFDEEVTKEIFNLLK